MKERLATAIVFWNTIAHVINSVDPWLFGAVGTVSTLRCRQKERSIATFETIVLILIADGIYAHHWIHLN